MPSKPKKHRDMGCEYHYNTVNNVRNIFTKFYLPTLHIYLHIFLTPCTTSHKSLKCDYIHKLCLCVKYEHSCEF